jgi:hypothetical protein
MLRLFALLLLVANGLFFVWSKGYLSTWGFTPTSKSESFRLNEQIEPERIVLQAPYNTIAAVVPQTSHVTAKTATVTTSASSTLTLQAESVLTSLPTTCLTSGVLNDKQSSLFKQALQTEMPSLVWRYDASVVPAHWIIYMGKYTNVAQLELKKKQLSKLNVRYEILTQGSLESGLSLGGYATQAAANLALQQLIKQGVRTARVIQELPEKQGQIFVAPAVDDASRAKLQSVYASLLVQLESKALQVCK